MSAMEYKTNSTMIKMMMMIIIIIIMTVIIRTILSTICLRHCGVKKLIIIIIIIIIIIGKDTISFMQSIYTYIPETNHVLKEYNVAAIL
jgi:membrane protein required for beta-lactamase induction